LEGSIEIDGPLDAEVVDVLAEQTVLYVAAGANAVHELLERHGAFAMSQSPVDTRKG
jgi:hypothetical protein